MSKVMDGLVSRIRKPHSTSRSKKRETPPKPLRIYSLTERQERWLREAEETKDGVYVPINTSGAEPDQLVEAGLASYREVKQTSDTPNPYSRSGKSEWTDIYLVPTDAGRAMRKAYRR